MDGQADRLRARVAATVPAAPGRAGTPAAAPIARAVAVASGKGGVGKSTLALGIAMAAAERGVRTALVDADLGLANLDLLAGVRPARTALDWMAGRARLAECFVSLSPRLWLLPGASGVARMADLDRAQRLRFVEGIARVSGHVQLLVVDLGAGVGAGTIDVAVAADRLVLATTPEPTALADAYGFAKACRAAGHAGGMACVTTMCRDAADGAGAADRLSRAARVHLGIALEPLGSVPLDPAVPASVRAGVPLLRAAPACAAARSIRSIEARLSGAEQGGSGGGFAGALAARLGLGFVRTAAAAAIGIAALGGTTAR